MLWSKLNKNMTHFNRPKYKYQQESFMKDKKTCFTKLNEKKKSNKNLFWKHTKPYFSDYGSNSKNNAVWERYDYNWWEENC